MIESEDHTYSVEDASVRIEVPEGYKNQYGEIDTDCIDTELELDIFRGRGDSTWLMDKRPFKLKLEKKADLLGMGKAKVNAIDYMFAECGALTQLDLESFDTKNVTDSSNMFLGCPLLKKIKTGKQWNLS